MTRIIRIRARRGIMLVEVLLALAITGLIAGTVVSMLFAVSGGTKDGQELRRRNVHVGVTENRIDGGIRSSCVLLGRSNRSMVLWIADSKHNQKPDLSELRRIEWDATSKQIRCYEAVAGLADASNTTYDLATTDFLAVTSALKGTANFPYQVWGNNVTAFATTPAGATQATRLVGYSLTLDTSGTTRTFRSSATLKGQSGLKGG